MPEAIAVIPEDGFIRIDITASATDTGPYTVLRRVPAGEWFRIGKDIAVGGEFLDYGVASGQTYDYVVQDPVGSNLQSSGSTTFHGVWLHTLGDISTAHNFFYDGEGHDENHDLDAEAEHYHGSAFPEVTYGSTNTVEVSADLQLVDADEAALERIVKARRPVCYRDGRGRLVLGVVRGFSLQETPWGAGCSLNVVTTDATLEV